MAKLKDEDRLMTRAEVIRMFNLYHSLHHVPWYRKVWRRLRHGR